MSHTKDRVMELMEADDSYDGESWLGEIILIQHQGSAMSHTARSQESQRKHGKTPPANETVLRLLESIRSEQVEPSQIVAHVASGDVRVNDLTDIREV